MIAFYQLSDHQIHTAKAYVYPLYNPAKSDLFLQQFTRSILRQLQWKIV